MSLPRLTLLGRSVLLIVCEIAANILCWTIAAILFARDDASKPVMSLGLLAWPWTQIISGLALIIEPFSAIDNATRGLISIGQLPVTCGLFFSLGHSTIVIIVTVAIAISSDIYERLHNVGEVGGIVGAAVSGSFLFIVGLANTIILWRILKKRRETKRLETLRENGISVPSDSMNDDPKHNHMLMMRLLGPILNFVNRPWKMYPIGVLFGFGFDTASSIALLAISAMAKRGTDGKTLPSTQVIILPFLFTAGMSLVDSADSVLMLYSYAGVPEKSWALFTRNKREKDTLPVPVSSPSVEAEKEKVEEPDSGLETKRENSQQQQQQLEGGASQEDDEKISRDIQIKMNVMSSLSIMLTLMSILVAFSISLITIMGLIGEQCKACVEAAEADDGHGGGLAGRWWRGWAKAGEQSGYIGAAIVGVFLIIVIGWYTLKWIKRRSNSTK